MMMEIAEEFYITEGRVPDAVVLAVLGGVLHIHDNPVQVRQLADGAQATRHLVKGENLSQMWQKLEKLPFRSNILMRRVILKVVMEREVQAEVSVVENERMELRI